MPAYPAKAELTAESGGTTITFMFNPSELSFSRSMQINSSSGARTDDGTPKVSFGYFNPYSLSISNILFDTYETGKDVMSEYISKLQDALEFKSASERRPPIYLFAWGDREYLRCFVQSLSYKLTLFLPDGTPVRAVVDLSLQQIDEWDPPPSTSSGNPSPAERSASSR
ncbi:hypothetical protein [Synechococcus sp. PCC 7336]|uniref:CIS tube protein n=1 Tax=Synechococcus sp. PCC 7336 TaxID=195250 RepID=UPI000348492C|nr:hypothetical protein [Synechococcus sp. PCC 7336]